MSYDPGQGGQQGWPGQQPGYPPPGYGQPQPPPGWGAAPGGHGSPSGRQANPFAALFDFSFQSFATPGLIKLLYIVGTVLLAVGWVVIVIAGFTQGVLPGLAALVLGGVALLFYLAFLRVLLEFYYAVVRMSEDIHKRP
jgi:hypothetical protein